MDSIVVCCYAPRFVEMMPTLATGRTSEWHYFEAFKASVKARMAFLESPCPYVIEERAQGLVNHIVVVWDELPRVVRRHQIFRTADVLPQKGGPYASEVAHLHSDVSSSREQPNLSVKQ